MRTKPNNLVKSVNRSINILEELAKYENGLGVTEIGNRLDVHKSSVHRLLSTLVYRGLVEQDQETGKYKLGLKLFELGSRIFNDLEVREYAKPYIEELVRKTNETVHLVTLDQGEVLYIDKVKSPETITMASQIGARGPIHCTGVGKAMAAYLAETEVDKIIKKKGMPKQTENTITDPREFKEHLDLVKERGYAIDEIENEAGIRCIAAPIFDYDGDVVAAVSVSGPTMRVTKERISELAKQVRETGLQISYRLGYNPNNQ
ncbi:transcriptional regulator [Halobacteroides halobius DSM 5150]|uniref:Glycerol operon regulatory protein n=1 Tax=Halobacteroides halobius (strain ATCC 35273 / DSM 5150 / MD-1) TaxID=748449 RepID=L0KBM8_HALHC|nr:IclR family transcriptional regulator [Halobacteroides halobius]AGB42406.1 transcriptional regulator [Halobacteroides halobius DSM 5150]